MIHAKRPCTKKLIEFENVPALISLLLCSFYLCLHFIDLLSFYLLLNKKAFFSWPMANEGEVESHPEGAGACPPTSPPPYEIAVSLPPTPYSEVPPPVYGSFVFHRGIMPRDCGECVIRRGTCFETALPERYRTRRRNSEGAYTVISSHSMGPLRSRSVSTIYGMASRRGTFEECPHLNSNFSLEYHTF